MNADRSLIVASVALLGWPWDLRAQDRIAAPSEPSRPVTSYALIDRALAAKEIEVEEAHVYRVFAAFGDTRLPDRYRGVGGGLEEPPPALTHAFRLLKTFSAQTQADLAPFFKRPASPGSWITLPTVRQPPSAVSPRDEDVSASLLQDAGSAAPNVSAADIAGAYPRATAQTEPAQASPWHTVRAAGGKVKVWAQLRYTGDSLKAEQVARELTSTIWRRLVGLFWEPLSDAHLDDNGGDGALDIYLVRADFGTSQPWKGRAEFADPVHVCGESPHYLLLDSRGAIGGATSAGILQTVAHELTHAITGRKPLKDFNCDEYVWIREATATWTEDWVYPRAQSEHETAQHFLRDPRLSLDHVSADETDKHHYGAYLLPFHLANHGQQLAIPAMWEQFGRHRSLDGIDAALRLAGTSLEEAFPKFTLENWNRPSVDDYKQADRLGTGANLGSDSIKVSVTRGTPFQRRIATGIRYLAAEYVYFDFDATVRQVMFENTLRAIPFASVWLLEKIKGAWQKPIDVSKTAGKAWCRDIDSEDIEALVVVISNTQWKRKELRVEARPENPQLMAFGHGCPGWNGSTTTVNTITSRAPNLTIVETVTSTLRFEIDSAAILPGQPPEYWKLTRGQLTWDVRVTGQCTGNSGGTFAVRDYGPGEELAKLRIWNEGGSLLYSGWQGPWPGDIPTYQITCPNHPPGTMTLFAALGWFNTDSENNKVSADGKSISGGFTSRQGDATAGITTTFRYAFRGASK